MKAVFKHEVSSYFTGLTGYVFGAFILLFTGIYAMVYNISGGLTNFEYVPASLPFIFIVIIPILTMRVISEEKKQKTDQLLYSLPISMTQVVIAKYMALMVVFLIPVLIMCVYPLVLTLFGNVYLPVAFGTLLSFYLLGGSLIAIGMFISSLTESQAVAAGVSFVVMVVIYFISDLSDYAASTARGSLFALTIVIILFAVLVGFMTKSMFSGFTSGVVLEAILIALFTVKRESFEGLFPSVMSKLSLFERFYVFVQGVFDITGIVYFLSIIGVCLFLTVQSLEKRRWS